MAALAGLAVAASTLVTGPASAESSTAPVSQMAGMAVPDVTAPNAASDLSRLKADGINTISLFVWWLAPARAGTSLAPYNGTTSDGALIAETDAARRLGMQVTLTPLFYCSDCEGGWRGTMAPLDMDGFFTSYRNFIDHYAHMAADHDMATLYVGSEMTSLETETAQWDRVISSARAIFPGRIAYEENWDVLGRARFLSDVDLIGVSAYFPLDDQPAPTLARLRADWSGSHASATSGSNWVAELDHLAASTGKPIGFGESGYMAGDYAGKQPFLNFDGQPDWQVQSDLYQALLETFSGKSWWAGAVWWEWGRADGWLADSGRSPGGKTAELLLKRWYALGMRPADPDTPLAQGSSVSAASAGTPATLAPAGTSAAGAQAAAQDAGAAVTRGGLDTAQRAGLIGLLVLLAALGLVCWVTLGREPAGRVRAAFATPERQTPDRGRPAR